jgi:hypothetical protein
VNPTVSGHYSAITPYVKPFFPPDLCSQPWLIDSVTAFSMYVLFLFVLFAFFENKMVFIIQALQHNKTPSTFSKLY